MMTKYPIFEKSAIKGPYQLMTFSKANIPLHFISSQVNFILSCACSGIDMEGNYSDHVVQSHVRR